MANRKKAEAFILEFCRSIEPTGYNVSLYTKILANMSDKDFHSFMVGLRDKTMFLPIFKPQYEATGLTTENNLKVAEKYGLKFFERLIHSNNENTGDFKTPIEYLVVDMPYRRQSQTLTKKVSVPDDNKVIDTLTYQPTGASKGASISFPELQILIGMGLDETIIELTKYRGGDKNGFNAYNAMAMRYGSINLKSLKNYASGVESTKTLKAYMLGMHISNTI